ncbi:hypothetical protein [Fluviicola taffensis]|uniref:Uncharacterized protein n=1 Tax=Fluviicola taffensis (strain DSM 16823 / NCIMB 13979 / RW262) TaxID=755732 RepID=F2IFP6_FLUTR|nr:hypothetical protein [Fluviicola taffensis]AEA42504.1 hypothetical protein Fluta_0499 [Fluviicola taffensis DSM 16823]
MMFVIILIIALLGLSYLFCRIWMHWNISIRKISFESIQDLQNRLNDPLVVAERSLRKTAFSEVNMPLTESFYTDEDLDNSFDFIIVRDRKTKTPLLSSRSYTNQTLIHKQLQAHETTDYLTLSLDSDEKYVLLDRLSAHSKHSLFSKSRKKIFINYYIHVLNFYPKHHLILMARSEPDERLLTKYLRLGFQIVGKQKHNQVDHWIVLLPGKNPTQSLAQSTKQYVLFKLFT